jgi:hypothetical protein
MEKMSTDKERRIRRERKEGGREGGVNISRIRNFYFLFFKIGV